jgi:hypothetical protein
VKSSKSVEMRVYLYVRYGTYLFLHNVLLTEILENWRSVMQEDTGMPRSYVKDRSKNVLHYNGIINVPDEK